jgi:hypothetical protein
LCQFDKILSNLHPQFDILKPFSLKSLFWLDACLKFDILLLGSLVFFLLNATTKKNGVELANFRLHFAAMPHNRSVIRVSYVNYFPMMNPDCPNVTSSRITSRCLLPGLAVEVGD